MLVLLRPILVLDVGLGTAVQAREAHDAPVLGPDGPLLRISVTDAEAP